MTARESKLAAVAAKVQEAGSVGSHGSEISAADMVKEGSVFASPTVVGPAAGLAAASRAGAHQEPSFRPPT